MLLVFNLVIQFFSVSDYFMSTVFNGRVVCNSNKKNHNINITITKQTIDFFNTETHYIQEGEVHSNIAKWCFICIKVVVQYSIRYNLHLMLRHLWIIFLIILSKNIVKCKLFFFLVLYKLNFFFSKNVLILMKTKSEFLWVFNTHFLHSDIVL